MLETYLAPLGQPGAILLETVLLPLLAVAAGVWLNPADPLWSGGGFPWVWLAPLLLALRYGPLPGLGAATVLVAAWFGTCARTGGCGDFPLPLFLGGLIATLLAGEFSSLWMARLRRAEATQRYLDQRLEQLTHQHYLLRLSHDRLEQDLIGRPMAMREALAGLRALTDAADCGAPLPGADALLRLLAQYCQIEVAALYAGGPAGIDPVACARLGAAAPLAADDPLIRQAVADGALAHVAEVVAAGERPSRYLVAAPLAAFDGERIGLLAVERLPFFALHDETLQTINLLLGYYANGLLIQRLAAPLQAAFPACPPEFAGELQRLWRLGREAGVQSTVVALAFPPGAEGGDLARRIGDQRRALDVGWLLDQEAGRPLLATLMPLAGAAAAAGYLARIAAWFERRSGHSLAAGGIAGHVLAVDQLAPPALLQRLIELCHGPAAAPAPRPSA